VDLAVFGDRVVVVAAAADPQGSPIPWLTAVDDAGNEVWTPLQLDARAGVEPTAAAAVSDGLTIVGREATTNVGGQRAWLARVDAAGAVESQDVIDTLADESFVAAAASGDLVAAVGARADDGWILWGPTVESTIAGLIPSAAAGRADGVLGVVGTILPSDTRWTLLLPGGQSLAQGGIEAEELRAIAFGPNGGYFVSGRRAGRPFLAAFAADGSAQWATDLDPSGGTALDVIADPATGDPFVAISNASTGSLSRLDDGGQPRWTTPLRIDGMDVVPVAVVTDPTGVVFVAGNRGSDATLARLTP
jgi:hypothetical protein